MAIFASKAVSTTRSIHSSPRAQQPGPAHFSYSLSASYSAKRRRLDPERNVYNFDPHVSVKRRADGSAEGSQDKTARPASGQDSFFISRVGDSDSVSFGVVDGVGGWEESGVDPADFAHGLCEYMAAAARSFPKDFESTSYAKPVEVLDIGHDRVQADEEIEAGGSTACVATANSSGGVEVANLGDSGFIHLGLNAVKFVSQPQTHAFNTPFQLSKLPKKMLEQMKLFQGGAKPFAEHPAQAAITHHQLRHGDILVFATDGVWDNLSASDILDIVARLMTSSGAWREGSQGTEISDSLRKLAKYDPGVGKGPASLAAALALAITHEAKEASLNRQRDGPFAKEVQRLYPSENWHGGKADDICVVVLIAVENDGVVPSKL